MAKVTSKLQVTIPKALAQRIGIKPGDAIDWSATSDGLRITSVKSNDDMPVELKLDLFDGATERQRHRQRSRGKSGGKTDRGWIRSELYTRGRSR